MGAEVSFHVSRVFRIARALHDQPAGPRHRIKRRLYLPPVEAGVVLEPDPILVGGVDLTDALSPERA